MRPFAALLAVAALVTDVSAHGYVAGAEVRGAWTAGANPNWYYLPAAQVPKTAGWKALNQDNGFVEPNNAGTADVNCHKSAQVGALFVTANAGDQVTFFWNTWPDTHKGPIINYISPYASSPTSLSWSKISQGGLVSGQTWVTDTLIANNFTSSVTLPKNLAAGDYVIRHEIIALHSAQSSNGAQLYPQCLNVRVGGSGSVKPTSGIPGTSLYKSSDLIFNLYSGATSYKIPGPALWTGAN